jgi:hypothetical protein
MAMVVEKDPEAKKLQEESFHLRLALDRAIGDESQSLFTRLTIRHM